MVASIAMAQQGYPVEINDIKSTPTEMLDRDEAMEPGEDSNNVKQDMSIDAYGRESAEETCATNVGSALSSDAASISSAASNDRPCARLTLDDNILKQKQFCGTPMSSPVESWGAIGRPLVGNTPSTAAPTPLAGDWTWTRSDSVDDDSTDFLSNADSEDSGPWVRPPIPKNARFEKHRKSIICPRGPSVEVASLGSGIGAAKASLW